MIKSLWKNCIDCFEVNLAWAMPTNAEKVKISELNVDNWNDNCEAKSEAKRPRPLRGLHIMQADRQTA